MGSGFLYMASSAGLLSKTPQGPPNTSLNSRRPTNKRPRVDQGAEAERVPASPVQYQIVAGYCKVPSIATFLFLFLVGLLNPAGVSAQDEFLNTQVTQLIRHLQDELPSIKETIRKLDEAPEPGMFTIWDKESYQDDLNGYLDDALSVLLPDTYRKIRDDLQEIDNSLRELRTEKSSIEAERAIEALRPTDKPGIVETVVSWLDDDIEDQLRELEEKITEQEGKRRNLFESFGELTRERFDLKLEESEIEALLYQVNGADLVDAIVVAKILTRVETHIRGIIVENTEVTASEVRLQYYGFALVVRLIVERLHARHLENYDTIYLAALEELDRESQQTLRENEDTLSRVKEDKQRRVTVEANIRLLGMAKRAIAAYRTILERRRARTANMLREAQKDALVARGTLRTLETVMNIGHVASKALAEFATLSEISSPDLLPLDDQELYNQYLDISKMLFEKHKE